MSKMFYHRPTRCLIVVHPYFLAQRDTDLLAESAHLSCAKNMHRRLMFFARLVQRKTSARRYQGKQERNIQQRNNHHRNQPGHVESNDKKTSHGRTIMKMVTPATEASV